MNGHRVDGRAVPEVRADEREQPEHEEAGDHVRAEEVVDDAGEPPHEVRLPDVSSDPGSVRFPRQANDELAADLVVER